MTLESIEQFVIPRDVTRLTDDLLRTAGQEGLEAFVLWSGLTNGGRFSVTSVHHPRQTSYKLPEGLCVRVDGDALHRLNIELFERRELLGVQVHTHPTDAYHSDTDDTYPIVTQLGGLSIVVPEFARDGTDGAEIAVFRLGVRGWDHLSESVVEELIEFEV